MDKRNSKIWAPVIGLDGFRKEQTAGREELLFNELHGERLIKKPHKHDFFIINLFDKASGVHTIDSIDHIIKDHQVHVLFPGQMHKWHIKTTPSLILPRMLLHNCIMNLNRSSRS
ncbi:hypothetical protein [Sphingobacterium sp. UBA5670]|uniref:hypothetical protein n=1 Tax=Sphingobacterium sp. UBA5670 TaxID=1947502 RepID=UPI0025DE3032|nr:hypothetical protein [Sphingobacterium sp. UBA5670]